MPDASHTSLVRHLSIASAERHHAAAGVGDAHHLERALHRAVLAEATVQRDEGAREALALEVEEVALGRIEGVRVDALLAQRREHRLAGDERDLPLGRRAAHEDATLPGS